MHTGRKLLTFLIAASVAMLPVVGVGAPTTPSVDMSISKLTSGDMSVSEAMSECCPPDAAPCGKATGSCADMAACAFSNFSFSGGGFADFVFPVVGTQILLPMPHQTLRSQTSSPPFRPPRV